MQGTLRILLFCFFGLRLGAVLAQDNKSRLDFWFLEAERQKLAGNYDAAIDLFDYCHQLDSQSAVVLSELADLYRYVKNDSLAMVSLERAVELEPENYWYRNLLVSLYLENHREDDALAVEEDMARRWPEKSDVLMMLLGLYEQKHDFANMVKVLDKIEVKEGKSEQLSMEKFRLFLQMDDEAKAFEEMQALAEEYPNDVRYQVVIGDLYLDADKKDEALRQFKEVEEKDPENVALLLSLANYYRAEGTDSLYQQYLTRLLTHKDVDEQTRVRMLGVLVRENLTNGTDSTALLTLFDRVLAEPQESTDLLELKVRYMVTKRMPHEQVKPYLKQMLELDPENGMARQQLLAYAIEENDTLGVVAICKPAVDYKADDPVFYYYLGVGYFQLDEKEKALEAFRAGLGKVENGEIENKLQMRVNMFALMGDIYHSMGQDEKAFQAYDSCLVYKQNDAMVLNNYAYYLSLKKKDLKRAEEMSRLSNELEPDNATYMDTYAWVLYQQKRYEEAKEWMDKTVELMEKEDEEMSEDVREHVRLIDKKLKIKIKNKKE